jgi:AmiR/NasT family two-component response regulator
LAVAVTESADWPPTARAVLAELSVALDELRVTRDGLVATERLYAGSVKLVSELNEAIVSRAVIEQAKGVLMTTQQCHDDQAFEILRRASQRTNTKVHDLAAELVRRTIAGEHHGGLGIARRTRG